MSGLPDPYTAALAAATGQQSDAGAGALASAQQHLVNMAHQVRYSEEVLTLYAMGYPLFSVVLPLIANLALICTEYMN